MNLKVAGLTCVFALLAAAITGCDRRPHMSTQQSAGDNAGMVELTRESAEKPVTVRSGERVRLSLSENPTTGYRWSLDSSCGDRLKTESDVYSPPDVQGGKLGASGEHVWIFRAEGRGTCDLTLRSARSWEKGTSGQALTFSITITD